MLAALRGLGERRVRSSREPGRREEFESAVCDDSQGLTKDSIAQLALHSKSCFSLPGGGLTGKCHTRGSLGNDDAGNSRGVEDIKAEVAFQPRPR